MSTRTIQIEHNGTTYEGSIGTIKGTRLGYEDHGVLTVMLDIKFDGGGIGVGGYVLDKPANRDDYGSEREGTPYGLDHIMRILDTVGVDRWESLPGKQVIVLYSRRAGWGDQSVGLAGTVNDKVFILKEHAEAWRDAVSS